LRVEGWGLGRHQGSFCPLPHLLDPRRPLLPQRYRVLVDVDARVKVGSDRCPQARGANPSPREVAIASTSGRHHTLHHGGRGRRRSGQCSPGRRKSVPPKGAQGRSCPLSVHRHGAKLPFYEEEQKRDFPVEKPWREILPPRGQGRNVSLRTDIQIFEPRELTISGPRWPPQGGQSSRQTQTKRRLV